MARIDIRLSGDEKLQLQQDAEQEGLSLSALVRGRVLAKRGQVSELWQNQEQLADAVNDLESRLSRLEEMAGL